MGIYNIEVCETLSRIIEVKAQTGDAALESVRQLYKDSKIVLDVEDFADYSITVL